SRWSRLFFARRPMRSAARLARACIVDSFGISKNSILNVGDITDDKIEYRTDGFIVKTENSTVSGSCNVYVTFKKLSSNLGVKTPAKTKKIYYAVVIEKYFCSSVDGRLDHDGGHVGLGVRRGIRRRYGAIRGVGARRRCMPCADSMAAAHTYWPDRTHLR